MFPRTYPVTFCPFLERVCDESGEFVRNGAMSVALSSRLCLETTESEEERSAIVCTKTCA